MFLDIDVPINPPKEIFSGAKTVMNPEEAYSLSENLENKLLWTKLG